MHILLIEIGTPYVLAFFGVAVSLIAWLCKSQIQTGKDVAAIQTTIKYYIERQTQDAARRLDVANPAPADIRALVQKHIRGRELTETENQILTTWLRWTGTGQNPEADGAERSAALQLLTGIRTLDQMAKRKKRWWQFT
jgi:hypothetical protein